MLSLRTPINIIIWIINFVFTLIGGLLALRIVLRLLGAREGSPFINWLYGTTDQLLAPFSNIFPASRLTGGFVIDFTAVFGLVIYLIIGYVIVEALDYITDHGDHREERVVVRKK